MDFYEGQTIYCASADIYYTLSYCSLCETYTAICPACGNNLCNGTYGEDGKCTVCPMIYEDWKDRQED